MNNEQRIIGFKTKNKINALYGQYGLKKPDSLKEPTNYFPLKRNIKTMQLHKVGPRNSYLMDVMEAKAGSTYRRGGSITLTYYYLILINVNTRFLIARILNKPKSYDKYKSEDVVRVLSDIMKDVPIHYLTSDNDATFKADMTQRFLYNTPSFKHHDLVKLLDLNRKHSFITSHNQRQDPIHSALGLVDRVIRTIRDMAYNMKIEFITPPVMAEIEMQYNNVPHQVLSKYAHFAVTPSQAQYNPELEALIVRNIRQDNYNTASNPTFALKNGTEVRVYNEKDPMSKRRQWIQPGRYFVDGVYEYEITDGRDKRKVLIPTLYRIRRANPKVYYDNKQQPVEVPDIQYVPRWMLAYA